MKQLDIDVSPPAFLWDLYLTLALTHVTFDLDARMYKICKIYENHMFITMLNFVNLT